MSTETRSARLICAAKGLREAVGVPVYVYDEPHRSLYERIMAAVRSRLDEAAWEAAWEAALAEGRAMTFEQAVENSHSIDKKTPRTIDTWLWFRLSLR